MLRLVVFGAAERERKPAYIIGIVAQSGITWQRDR